MADDTAPLTSPGVPAPEPSEPATPPAPAPSSPTELQELRETVSQLRDVVQTMARPATSMRGSGEAPSQPGTITPQERMYLRQQGVSDADIDQIGPLVRPFAMLELAKVAPEVVQLINQNRDDVQILRAERDSKQYPDWGTVIDKSKGLTIGDKAAELRAQAMERGQPLSVRQAYEAAVALNVDAVVTARETQRKSSVAHDATVQGSLGRNTGGRAGSPASGSISREQLRSMTPEQRKEFFDRHGDTPIQ